jgi:hypothetical protein
MWNVPTDDRLSRLPQLYETEHIPLQEKLVYIHFFLGSCDWYVCEYDGQDTFWGYAILNGDFFNAEWGYVSFSELKSIKLNGWLEVDCETEESWQIRSAGEIELIRCTGKI